MAEIIDLNINIGANTTDFESSLIKAENLLKQFEAALKKSTNVGEINYLNTQIDNLNATITSLNQRMNSIQAPTTDATIALSNLSRVAQDAPYGFIGIANNLNPLLESFQRLTIETGSSRSALQAMVAGLTGPAGIGLALGVVSSLAVTYSDEIAEFFIGPTEKLKEFRDELKKLNGEIYKIVGEAQSNRTVGLNLVEVISGGNPTQQQEALKRLKSLYSDNAAIKEATIKTDKAYLIHLVNVASKQEEFASKEKNTQDVLDAAYSRRRKLEAERETAVNNVSATTTGSEKYNKTKTDEARKRVSDSFKAGFAEIDKDIATAKKKNLELINAVTDIPTPDAKVGTKKGNSPIVNYAREENKQLTLELAKMKALREKMKSIGLEPLKLFELPSETRAAEDKRKGYFEKQAKDLAEQSDKSGFGKYMQGLFKRDKSAIDADEAETKRINDLKKSYEDFAYALSGSVTNALLGMYDAMQQGQSPLQAIGDMFANIGRQIAAAVVQAIIFKALLDAFPELKGVFAAVGSSKGIGKLLGLASGGVATGPTLAMIGEGGESEAVLPLSKLGNIMRGSFNAGSMNSGSSGGYGGFVLRGQDLLLSVNRAQKASNLKGQNISLA